MNEAKEKEIERICKTKISEKIKNPFKISIFENNVIVYSRCELVIHGRREKTD